MYIVKEIIYDKREGIYEVNDGLRCYKIGDNYEEVDQFFGKSTVTESLYAPRKDYVEEDDKVVIPYITSFDVRDLGDGYKQIDYFVGARDEMKGYIVKVQFSDSLSTDGKKIYGRYYNEIIVLLKEGNYLKINGEIVKVVDGKFCVTF